MIINTLSNIIEIFNEALSNIEVDAELSQDAEYQYLSIIINTLENTSNELNNAGLSEETKLAVAATRVPGLLYLHQIYA